MSEHESMSEKVSALLDGELREHECQNTISALTQDAALRKRWESYHVASDALKKHLPPLPLNHQLADRVMLALESEPTIFAPNAQRSMRAKPLLKQAAGLAVAASVTALAIFGLQSRNIAEVGGAAQVAQTLSPAPAAPAQTAAVVALPSSEVLPNVSLVQANANAKPQPPSRLHSQLQEYLVMHHRQVVGVYGMLPYARIVGYNQNEAAE